MKINTEKKRYVQSYIVVSQKLNLDINYHELQ